MSLNVKYTSKFKKDFKKIEKRKINTDELEFIVNELREQRPLAEKYCDHALAGKYYGHRECHIHPDWLLLYIVNNHVLTLTLTHTGSHSDLFI